MRLGEVEQLLLSFHQSGSRDASRAYRDEGLNDVEPGSLPVGIGIEEGQDAVAAEGNVKNQKIKRRQRRGEGVSEIAQAHAGHIQNAGRDSGAGDRGAQIGLQHDEPEKNQNRRGCRQQRVAPVVDRLDAAFEEVGKEEDHYRLLQLRRLERKSASMDPAMGVMRAVEEKN